MNFRLLSRAILLPVLTIALFAMNGPASAAEKPAQKQRKAKAQTAAANEPTQLPSPVAEQWELTDSKLQRDFPAMALDAAGTAWIAFIEHDGKADVLKLARKAAGELEIVATLSEPGIVHQPAISCDASGAVWSFWGQVDERDIVTLRARR